MKKIVNKMSYQSHICCDNPECDYITHFYSKEMFIRCNAIIDLNLTVAFNFKCAGCGGIVTISKRSIIKNVNE